jgi:hypothetical protein
VAALPWNQWQLLRGMGGRLRLESVATLVWNTHPRIVSPNEYGKPIKLNPAGITEGVIIRDFGTSHTIEEECHNMCHQYSMFCESLERFSPKMSYNELFMAGYQ